VTRQYADDTYLKRDGSSAVAGVVDMSNNRLMNLGDPLGSMTQLILGILMDSSNLTGVR
jgi:hypothetical protein